MAKTITISMSNELYNRVQDFKSEFNVSKVCQEAIDRKLMVLESAESDDLLTFLKKGKSEVMWDGKNLGKDAAFECINKKYFDYKELVRVYTANRERIKNAEELTKETPELIETAKELTPDYAFQILQSGSDKSLPPTGEYVSECYHNLIDKGLTTNIDDFYIGFLEGLVEFWETVKGDI